MYLSDLSALDKLLDFHNENTLVVYKKEKYTIYDLKELFIDENKSMSLDDHDVNNTGIYFQNTLIVNVFDLRKDRKDDLISL